MVRGWELSSLSLRDSRFVRQNDAIYTASCLIYSLYTIWDMRSLGYVGTAQAMLIALVSTATGAVVGPAAAFTGTWCWHEHIMSSFPTTHYPEKSGGQPGAGGGPRSQLGRGAQSCRGPVLSSARKRHDGKI